MLTDEQYAELSKQAHRIGKPAVSAFLTLVSQNAGVDEIRRRLIELETSTILRRSSGASKGEHMKIRPDELEDLRGRARRISLDALQYVERKAARGETYDAVLHALLDRVAPARPNVRHFTDIDDDTFIRSLTNPVEDRLG